MDGGRNGISPKARLLAAVLLLWPWALGSMARRAPSPLSPLPSWASGPAAGWRLQDLRLPVLETAWRGWTAPRRAWFHANVVLAAEDSSRATPHQEPLPFLGQPPSLGRSPRPEPRPEPRLEPRPEPPPRRGPSAPLAPAAAAAAAAGRDAVDRGPGSLRTGDAAGAGAGAGAGEYCNYGGFFSVVVRKGRGAGRCLAPWALNRDPGRLGALASLHVRYEPCGGRNLVRCSPVLYGFAHEHPGGACRAGARSGRGGCCVEVEDENDRGGVTGTCNERLLAGDPERLGRLVESLARDPARLARYLASVLPIVRDCPEGRGECDALKDLLRGSLERLEDRERLGCFHRELAVLDVDMDFLADLSRNLDDARLDSSIRRAFQWRRERRGILDGLLRRLERDGRTDAVVGVARENAESESTGRCYRYVKEALAARRRTGRGGGGRPRFAPSRGAGRGWTAGWYGGRFAKDAQADLERQGFVDVSELGFPLDPARAPRGSVVVYGGGRAGHIDIVDRDARGRRTYVSDHVRDRPISEDNPARWPVAVMVPMGNDDRERLGLPRLPCAEGGLYEGGVGLCEDA